MWLVDIGYWIRVWHQHFEGCTCLVERGVGHFKAGFEIFKSRLCILSLGSVSQSFYRSSLRNHKLTTLFLKVLRYLQQVRGE